MCSFLAQLRPAALIIDSYAAHFTQAVRSTAASLNIQLIKIPAGCTSDLQPLGVGFNGPLLMNQPINT